MKTRLPLLLLLLATFAHAEPPPTLHTTKIKEGLHLIAGPGGNIALMVGKDAVFIIDDQIAPMSKALKAEITAVTPKPVRFVLNTHWHGDHTGGNEMLGEAGAVIVAHDNVRRRLAAGQLIGLMHKTVPPAPAAALPIVTFSDSVTLHINDDDIQAIHVAPAHTDGDSLVVFKKLDVIHMGDTFFNGTYPFIDLSSGGAFEGIIAAADKGLQLAGDATTIIPGHGPLATKKELRAYRDMMVAVRDRIRKLIKAGRTLAEVQAAKPTADFDAAWGNGFMKPPLFVEIAYQSLSAK